MKQVRELGYLPKESHDPKERSLAHDLRKARDAGIMRRPRNPNNTRTSTVVLIFEGDDTS